MSNARVIPVAPLAPLKGTSEFKRITKVMFGRWVVIGGTAIIALFILVAIFAPLLAPYDPIAQNLKISLQQPSAQHWLGTDNLGRDALSRLIFGSRISLLVGIVAVTIAGAIGITLGMVAGYFGGWINTVIMRFIDALLALPPIVLMLAITAVLGGGLINVLIGIGIGMMPTYCRLMCGQILALKSNDYVTAARLVGGQPCPYHVPAPFTQCLSPSAGADYHEPGYCHYDGSFLKLSGNRHQSAYPHLGRYGQQRL